MTTLNTNKLLEQCSTCNNLWPVHKKPIIGRPKKDHVKNQASIRLLDSDKELLIRDFGSIQRAIDMMVLRYIENKSNT